HLAVQGDPGLPQPAHEARVREVERPAGRVDPDDPEGAELALPGPAVAVGEREGAGDRLGGRLVEAAAAAPVALGLLEDLLPALAGLGAALGAWHGDLAPSASLGPGGRPPRRRPARASPRRRTPARRGGPGLGGGARGTGPGAAAASGRRPRRPAACAACASAWTASTPAGGSSTPGPGSASRCP